MTHNPDRRRLTCASIRTRWIIRAILHTARTIAIVGLSSNVLRPSHFVGFYLQRHGYRIVPVNPRETRDLGRKVCYASLSEIPFHVDVVDVFRAPACGAGDRRGGRADRRRGAVAAVRRHQSRGSRDRRRRAASTSWWIAA